MRLTAPAQFPVTKLRSLSGLTTLWLPGNNIGDAGAKAIAETLTNLTSLNLWNNEIGEAGAKAIAETLTNLTSLELVDNEIGDAGAKAIAETLTNLTSLNLGHNDIGDAGAKAIAETLTNLTSLDLWRNKTGEAGAKAIAETLTNLTSLNLGGNNIGDAGAKAIAETLTNLTSLSLWNNDIGEAGAKAIAETLTNLTLLDIGSNDIGDASAKAIAETLTNLTSLDLWRSKTGEAGAKAIAETLTNLTSLNLGGNNIGDAGAKAIAETLTNLTSLNLWNNDIGEVGAKAIAETLTNLTSLELMDNEIGEAGAKAIAETLTNLTSLNLGHNDIGDAGAKAIAETLTNLTSLELDSNNIGDAGARTIAENLTNLTSLNLWFNNIGEAGAKAIAKALTNLTSLELDSNNIGDAGARAIADNLTDLTSLQLGGNDIGDAGAKAIAENLTNLTSLQLWRNNIGDAGARAIAEALTNLTSLSLNSNNIGDAGARAIAETLNSLTSLGLSGNNIGDVGAKVIAENLTSLIWLYLGGNKIGDAGAKAIAETLTNLTSLDLGDNDIGDAGARAIAENLTGLTSLDLGRNKIGIDGARAVFEAWSPEAKRARLQSLNLRDNEDLGDLLTKEVLESEDAQAILAAYRRYQADSALQTLRPLNEAKLLVVGNEAVGKTSLLRFLVDGEPRDPNQKKTPGVATHEQIETASWSPETNADRDRVSLNVWDFGGQEIMRGTHRFFLTERSLYLLVLEDRRQDDEPVAENWLKTIVNRGGESPIIVVINKSDGGKEDLRLNEARLLREYPNIVRFVRTSCEADDWARDSIADLRWLIAKTILDHPQLKHVRDPFPPAYLRVKKELGELARERSVLTPLHYQRICEQGIDEGETITNPDEQRALLRLLHDLGVVVAHGLDRDAPAAIRGVTLLDPNWLTGAIYQLLNEPRLRDQDGEFERSQMSEWLDPQRYPNERHEFVLEMMQDPDVGLCFPLHDVASERYLVPEALPANEPDYDNWPADSLRFRYNYAFLPAGLIPRFIVQAHRNLTKRKTRWRTGVVLEADKCRILVSAGLDRRRIDIAVDGPEDRQRSALSVVLDDLDAVHEKNPECGPEARVPLPDNPEEDVGYEHLQDLQELEGLDYKFYPEGSKRSYTVRVLLEGTKRTRRREKQEQSAASDSPAASVQVTSPTWERAAIFGVGVAFVFILLIIAFVFPDPTVFQLFIFRTVLALGAAGIGALIPGWLDVEFKGWLRAGGAIAMFALVYFINPPQFLVDGGPPASEVAD